ncbi:MAG TPA: 2,3,4,5-tetrahydropyridine-2,6-dicarboxylate N-succinyltransferase [Gemmatimonadaceae bacterium]|nr:2,3,4,5-tetrahydropyridine-2,6-dicarboxylate N-succinyltransferase [Gemmatimonadaceae bacterium]
MSERTISPASPATHTVLEELRARIERASEASAEGAALDRAEVDVSVRELLDALERGEVRAAERGVDGIWNAVAWVKAGIMLAFRIGELVEMGHVNGSAFRFFDRHPFSIRDLSLAEGVRVVPGGSIIRRGAYVAPGVICMPPMLINIGSYVGANTTVDSHALVGSCAQVGARVHLSAAAQLGGVLEPAHAAPVIVEDEVFIGGNCGVYEGTVIRRRAVLASGVILTRATPVYDLVREVVHRAEDGAPLEIPEGAVVVPGARPIATGWGAAQHLSMQTPIIVKYRDEHTDAAIALEPRLR